eukprot:14869019-Ditylum_brightwellii.AAC.1
MKKGYSERRRHDRCFFGWAEFAFHGRNECTEQPYTSHQRMHHTDHSIVRIKQTLPLSQECPPSVSNLLNKN